MITIRAVTAPALVNSTSVVINKPTGTLTGDLMLLHYSSGTAAADQPKMTTGWELLAKSFYSGSDGISIYWKVAGAAEPASWTLTTVGTSNMGAGVISLYDSLGGTLAIADPSGTGVAKQFNTTSTNKVFPSVTAPTAADLLLCFGSLASNVTGTPAAGMTEQYDTGAGPRMYLMTEALSAAGATGTRTATGSTSTSRTVSLIVTIGTQTPQTGPFYRSFSRTNVGSYATPKTLAAPADLAVGDMMLMQLSFGVTDETPVVPAGWTAVPNGAIAGTNSIRTYWKIAEAADIGATYSVSYTGTKIFGFSISAYYSPAGYDLHIDASDKQDNTTTSTTQIFPAISPTKTTSLLCLLAVWVAGSNGTTTSAETAERYEGGTGQHEYLQTEHLFASGTTGTRTVTVGATTISRCVSIALAEREYPAAPTTLAAVASAFDTIGLTWADLSNNETGFEIQHSTDGVGFSLLTTTAANAVSYSHTGLTEHSQHWYKVNAINADGPSGFTSTADAVTFILPPTTLAAVAIDPTRIDLSWVDNSGAETGYKIDRSPAGAGTWTLIHTTTANVTSYADTSAASDTAYDYRILAYVGGDSSTYSNTASATTPLVAPTGLTATPVLSTKITLAWADAGTSEDGYKVERSPEGTSWSQIGTTAANVLTYEDISLAPATIFYYRVRGYHGANHSDYSGTASATTFPALVAPTDLAALVLSTTEISLSWADANAGVDGWSLERSLTGVGDWVVVYSPTESPQVDSGLTTGVTYYWRIRAQRTG